MSDLTQAFSEYLTINKGLSQKSVQAYINDIKQFESFLNKGLLSVDTSDIIDFLKNFKNARTLNRKLSSINSFYNFCKELDFSNLEVNIPSSKIQNSLPHFLEHETIINAVNNIKPNSWLNMRDRALILFLYATGVRVSEAISVNVSDIEGSWLRVRFAKNQKERVVPIAKIALKEIKNYLNNRPKNCAELFVNYKFNKLSRISVFKITKKYLNVSPHILRHSYATSLILGGADLRVVQELLGHSSLVTTQIYTHIKKSHLKDTINSYHPLSKNDF
jgi:integrase/recombinase XerD